MDLVSCVQNFIKIRPLLLDKQTQAHIQTLIYLFIVYYQHTHKHTDNQGRGKFLDGGNHRKTDPRAFVYCPLLIGTRFPMNLCVTGLKELN